MQRVRLPLDWESTFPDRPGRVRFTRRFHKPTNLGPNEAVVLVTDSQPKPYSVSLNGCNVGSFYPELGEGKIVVTPLLQPINTLTVEMEVDFADRGKSCRGSWGEFVLEIGVV